MKLIFMGTPDFAVPTLKALKCAGHEIEMVVTQPDRARDRGKKISESPVKLTAKELGLSIAQPESLRNNADFLEDMRDICPDAIIVAAYGKILPKEILEIPRLGCINVHASLLPKYRGAAPMQHAILNGEGKTGVTIMRMEEGLDTGAIYSRLETPVDHKDYPELSGELAELGAGLLVGTLKMIEEGLEPEPQDEAEATYAGMIYKEDGRVVFSEKTAAEIERMIRAYNPWPGVFCDFKGEKMKIKKASVIAGGVTALPGDIIKADDEGIDIATMQGVLRIEELQLPGKKAMPVGSFLRGNKIPEDGFKK